MLPALTLLSIVFGMSGLSAASSPTSTQPARPNIILILADDLGYSDLGCYGSEIATPNLDRLAAGGLRFTQFYNAARCCPTRAALLTGRYNHSVGIGHMTGDRGLPGYTNHLSTDCVTIAEALRKGGYHALMAGKWHVGGAHPSLPLDRGFEHYFGILSGACNYFRPEAHRRLMLENEHYVPTNPRFYMTDAISDKAVGYVRDYGRKPEPFFLYVAYTAPHGPLHAWSEDIAKYRGKYRIGWDELRRRRHQKMIELGVVDARWPLAPREPDAIPWKDVADKETADLKMSVYAAQIECMDRGIGRIVETVRQAGIDRNTLILFLSDNGGDAEDIDEGKPGAEIGTIDSFIGYGPCWANASNTPFRRYKRMTHEGGTATPLIAYWPAGITQGGRITPEVGHVIDLLPTCLDAAGVPYPSTHAGESIRPADGLSFLPVLEGRQRQGHEYLFWEHEGNRAVRHGRWKLVSNHPGPWELYDIEADRTELNDLSSKMPEKVKELSDRFEDWAKRNNVVPWDQVPPVRRPGAAKTTK